MKQLHSLIWQLTREWYGDEHRVPQFKAQQYCHNLTIIATQMCLRSNSGHRKSNTKCLWQIKNCSICPMTLNEGYTRLWILLVTVCWWLLRKLYCVTLSVANLHSTSHYCDCTACTGHEKGTYSPHSADFTKFPRPPTHERGQPRSASTS